MKKLVLLLVVVMALPAMSFAAEKSNVTISGSLEFNAVHRENTYDFDDDETDMDNFVDAYVLIDIKAELTDNVSVLVELGNQRHCTDRFGEDGFELEVKEAWVQLKEFIDPHVTAKLGLQNFAYSLRNDGNYFLLNTKETHHLATVYDYYEDENEDIGNDVGGLKFTIDELFGALPCLSLDIFWFRAYDDGDSSRRPEASDDPGDKAWFDAYGLVADYNLSAISEKSHAQFTALNIHDNNTGVACWNYAEPCWGHQDWWALSPGIDLFFGMGDYGELEVYAEYVWEFGEFHDYDNDDNEDVGGQGGRIGAEFKFKDVAWNPVIGASYWYLTGDDDGDDMDQFLMFGTVSETLIAEDSYYGMAVGESPFFNSNMEVWRVYVGAEPMKNTSVKLQYNDFTANESWDYDDALGQEIDLFTMYKYSDNVTFRSGIGYFMADDFIDEYFGEDDDVLLTDFRVIVTF